MGPKPLMGCFMEVTLTGEATLLLRVRPLPRHRQRGIDEHPPRPNAGRQRIKEGVLLRLGVDRPDDDDDVHARPHPSRHQRAVNLVRRKPQTGGGCSWPSHHRCDVINVSDHGRAPLIDQAFRQKRRDGVLAGGDRAGDGDKLGHACERGSALSQRQTELPPGGHGLLISGAVVPLAVGLTDPISCRRIVDVRRLLRFGLGAVAVAAFLSACTSSTGSPSPSAPATGGAETLVGEPTATTSCDQGVGHSEPEAGYAEILDTVVFGRLQQPAEIALSGEQRPRYFAKVPVWLHSGSEVVISVDPEQEGDVAVAWASYPAGPTSAVSFAPCDLDSDHEWTTYPGGFYTDQKRCVRIRVEVDGRSVQHEVPLGIRCP